MKYGHSLYSGRKRLFNFLVFLLEDKINIPSINKEAESLSDYKDRILDVDRIYQKKSASYYAQIPEKDGDYAFLRLFARNPYWIMNLAEKRACAVNPRTSQNVFIII